MSQRNIDFGSFPDDPSADAIRTAFEKVQQNFTELYTGTGAGVTSVVAGQGIELGGTGASTGTVVIEADIACIQVQTSTLSLGVLGSSSDESYVLIPSSSQILTIDLPANLTIEDLELSGNLTVEGVSVLGNTASANYFIGDGGLLSNLTVSGGTSIDAGTSNVVVDTNSNVRTSVAGNANIFVVTGTGANVSGYFTITGNVIANNLGNVSSVNLDSSNSNVLYGNGVFAPASGGNANTGNVTFDDVTVQGDNSQLNLSAGADFTANLAYLQVRSGDVASHIHMDTGNNEAYDLIVGDDQKFVQVSSTGNIIMSSYDGNTSHIMTLDTTGNLILAGGNSVIQSIANSSLEPLYPNVSTMVFTPDALYSSQSLVLDPTGPTHIHLRAPGANIDEPDANIFLGGEDSSFEVGYYNGAAPNLYIHSGGNTWTFDNTGNLTLPANTFAINYANGTPVSLGGGGSSITNGTSNVVVDPSANVRTSVAGTSNVLVVTSTSAELDGNLSVSGNAIFGPGNGGNLTGGNVIEANTLIALLSANLGNSVNANYFIGNGGLLSNIAVANITGLGNIATANLDGNSGNVLYGNGIFAAPTGGGGGSLPLANGNSNIDIATVNGNVTVTANGTHTWTFDDGGNLTLPGGGTIFGNPYTPSGSPGNTITLQPAGSGTVTDQRLLIYPTAGDGDHIHMTSGNLYQTELFLGSDNLYVKLANTGNIVINSDDGNSNTAMWTFGTDGNLTLPNNTFAVNYANGTPVSLGGGGGSSITNGTSNVVVQSSGNVNTSVAGNSNVFVVTGAGAIVNGNLSVTGNANFGAGSGGNLTGGNVIEANTLVALLSANLGNSVTANFFIGNGGLLSNIAVANITGLGNIATANLDGNSGNVLYGNGIFAAPTGGGGGGSSITNGTSNVVVESSGNVNTSVAGNSNIFTVTGTGSNIAGNLDVTGNITAYDIASANAIVLLSNTEGSITGANSISANYFIGDGGFLSNVGGASGNQIFNGTSNVVVLPSGNVTTSIAGNPNITVATSTGFIVNGVMNVIGNANTSNFNASGLMVATGNVTGGNILTAGTVTASRLISNVAQGTAPFAVSSNTLVANLNANLLNNLTTTTANTGTTIAQRFSNGALAATVFVGNISSDSANQSNITGLGNLTSLIVTGNITGGNLSSAGRLSITGAANSNVGNLGANLLVISGNLTSGNANLGNIVVANYLSVSEDLTVVGNTIYGSGNGGNITGAFLISANYFSGDGSNLTTTNSVNSSVVASGSTQTDANALVNTINIISTVDTGQGVRLPTPTPGAIFYIINISANAVQVYPNTNGVINNLGANNAITHNSNVRLQYVAATTSQWYTLGTL